MDGNLEIEGDLYFALDHFLGQMGKFQTDESALKKLIHSSLEKKNQKKEVQSHYDIGNDFYQLWLDETLPQYGQKFDCVVSVGMVEHVGRENYQLFMECVKKVMKPGGLFLLHFISALKEHAGDPWIKKYIFPGGVVSSLREMLSCAAENDFHTMNVENLRLHYNRTLLCWKKNFEEHTGEVEKMFDERFVRMWDLYLSACAATFHNGIIDLRQVLFTNGINNELPMVRWY